MRDFDVVTVTSNDRIKQVEDTMVPPAEEKRHIDEMTIISYSSSKHPARSEKTSQLITKHIPVQQMIE